MRNLHKKIIRKCVHVSFGTIFGGLSRSLAKYLAGISIISPRKVSRSAEKSTNRSPKTNIGADPRLLGFSLIEVMIAVVLMGMMGVLLMTSLNTSARAKSDVEQLSMRFQEARQAMARMSREISMAYLSKNLSPTDPPYITQFKGKKHSLFFSAFGHVVYQKDAKESDLQVLGFYLADNKDGTQSLMRRVHPNLNNDVEKGGRSQVLCSNVTKLEFAYFDSRLNKWDESWIADPSIPLGASAGGMPPKKPDKDGDKDKDKDKDKDQIATPKPWRLPAIVKISMTMPMEEGHEMTWVSEAEIVVQTPLDLN